MSPADVRAARAALGVSPEFLSFDLGVAESEVVAWEAGTRPVPARKARRLAYLAACEEALKRAGVQECARWKWLRELDALGSGPEALERKRAILGRWPAPQEAEKDVAESCIHQETCPVCIARFARGRTLVPPPPDPGRTLRWVIFCVLFNLAVALLPLGVVVVLALLRGRTELLWPLVPNVLGLAVLAGATGGVAGGLVRGRVERMGKMGGYLTGVAILWGYGGVIMAWEAATGWLGGLYYGGFTVYVTLIGAFVGHALFNQDLPE